MKKNVIKAQRRGRPSNPESRAERIQQILDGARKAIVEKGFHGASISDISTAADVSAANIYQYFSSKDDLIVALAEDDLRQDIELIKSIAGADLRVDQMARYLGAVFSSAEGLQKCRMRIEILSEASRNAQVADLVRKWDLESANTIHSAIVGLQQRKRVSSNVSTQMSADQICVLYEGLTNRYVINHKSGRELLRHFVAGVYSILGLKEGGNE